MNQQPTPRSARSQQRSAVSEWTAKRPNLTAVRVKPRKLTRVERFAAWMQRQHDTNVVLWVILVTVFLSGTGAIVTGWWHP